MAAGRNATHPDRPIIPANLPRMKVARPLVSPAGEDDDEHMQNMFAAMPLLARYLYLLAAS